MTNTYDIIKVKSSLVLVIAKEEIGRELHLLKGVLLSSKMGFCIDEDFLIDTVDLQEGKLGKAHYAQMWNESVYLIDSKKVKKVAHLNKEAVLRVKRFFQNQDDPAEQVLDVDLALFHLNQRKKVAKLSLPYKKYVYALSNEEEWEIYERMYFDELKKEKLKLKALQFTVS